MTVELALDRLRAGDVETARACLMDATVANDPRRHAALGMVHLAAGDSVAAIAALRAAVAIGDVAPTTLLNLAMAEDQAGDVARAHRLMEGLATCHPEWDEPWLRLAESKRRAGSDVEAILLYERTLEINPQRREALVSLAALRMRAGQPVEAQMLLLRACNAAPGSAEVWDALGVALMMTHDARAAEGAFASAQALAPDDIGIAIRRVEAAMEAGGGVAELARLEAVGDSHALDIASLAARGVLLGLLGEREQAIDILEAAVALAPNSPHAVQALGTALMRANRVALAAPVLAHAVELAPKDAALRNNLAAVLIRLNRHREARAMLEGVLEQQGESPGVLCNLTNALVSLGLQEEGLATAKRAVALAPGSSIACRAMCNALAYHAEVTPAGLLAAQQRVATTLAHSDTGRFTNVVDPERRLRIGLLSATLKTHPVGWLTVAAFEALDPTLFDLVCFGQPASSDAIQRRFATIASAWHEVDGLPPTVIADRIREAEIDILIDLGGFGDMGMLAACAHRAAPVQIKWVGAQAHSTGLPEMDWFITDRWETPPELAEHYSEKLLYMADGYVCYSPPAYAPDVTPSPALARNAVTFGCFNNLSKITPVVIATWSRILQQVPGSRLILKGHQFGDAETAARLHAAFEAHGVAPSRVEMRGGSPHRALLGQYGEIDIVLDPFPYTGGLTTCEALWMGVPTVCVTGETFAGRHSTSHMCNAGLPDWVASDIAGYEAIAVGRARDIPALAALRAGLRAQVKASPLCDAPRFGAQFGAALRRSWAEWCAAQA